MVLYMSYIIFFFFFSFISKIPSKWSFPLSRLVRELLLVVPQGHTINLKIKQFVLILSKWVMFNAKWAILQLNHAENKIFFNEMMITMPAFTRPNKLSWIFSSSRSLEQQSTGWQVTPLGHIIMTLS